MNERDAITGVLAKLKLPVNLPSLSKQLMTLLPTALLDPRTTQELHRQPFPDVWPRIASKLTQVTAAHLRAPGATAASAEPEWRVFNRHLIAGYFNGCCLPDARTVTLDFREFAAQIVPVRGSLTRLVENVSVTGDADDPPPKPIIGGSRPVLKLRNAKLSVLMETVQAEAQAIETGQGVMHRVLGSTSQRSTADRGVVTHHQMERGRDAAWRLYEYTCLAYLALACIDQLLRSWATRRGLNHVKVDGTPLPITRQWFKSLPISPVLRADIEALYSADGGNVRNRIVHGGLIDIEAKRLEIVLPIANPSRYKARMAARQDPWSQRAIARNCLNVLQRIDDEVVAEGGVLGAAELTWMASVAPSSADVLRGQQVHCDFLEGAEEALAWQERLNGFLSAVFPSVKQCFAVSFHGWSGHFNPTTTVPQFLFLVFTFEPIFRLVAHLIGCPILQRPEPGAVGAFKVQYRMLEARDKGLCTSDVFDQILADVNYAQRPLARDVIMTAVHLRNALAHGALLALTPEDIDGLGHIVVKATQALVSAAHRHLVKEAAYYNYLERRRAGRPGDQGSDWTVGEGAIARLLRAERARKAAMPGKAN
jgi:hypothetical protein